MTNDSPDSAGPSLTRRQVLAATSGSALVGVAGCSGDSECEPVLSKDAQGDFHYGQDVAYVFEVCNEGDAECTEQLEIRDVDGIWEVAADIGNPSGNWNLSGAGGTVKLFNDNNNGLGPGECSTTELPVTLKTACEFDGDPPHEAENCAEVYHPSGGDTPSDEDCVTREVTHDSCDLSVEKDTDGEFHLGQQATYTIEVCNEGETVCTGPLTIEDDLPDGVSLVGASGDWTATVSGGVVTATNNSYCSLDPGDCITLELTVEVAPASQFPGDPPVEVENCATLLQADDLVDEDCLTHDITADTCRLSLAKNTDGEFNYGGQATYTYEICNEQEEECTGPLTIEDDLPDGISFVSVSGNWTASVSGGVVEATNSSYGGLAPGECITLEVTVEVAPADQFPGDPPVEVENCATLLQFGELVTEDCVTHPVTPGECGLALSKETNGEFIYGEEGTYVFEVCNEGDGTCTGPLEIEDSLPTGISFVDVGSGWTANQSGGVVTLTNSNNGLAPGECTTVEMTVDIVPPGEAPSEVENCAALFHDGDLADEDCVAHPLSYEDCELSVEKSVDGEFHFGQENTYVFEICNEEDEPCGGPLTIEDDLPDGISFVDISGFWNATVSGGVVEATLDTSPLDPGECITAEMTVDVAPESDFPGGEVVENCATLAHDGEPVADDCVEHPITPDPCELSLSKDTGEFGGFHYGGLGTYVFEICNVGDTGCSGPLTVEDNLANGISVVSTGSNWSTSVSGGVVTATNDSHDGLAPGECLTVEMTVAVDDASAFPGEPPQEVDNCATLSYAGSVQAEDCVTHTLTLGDPGDCPPVEHSLNTGYDQSATSTLGDGDDDDDWQIQVDTTGSGPVPRPATVVESGVVSGTWPSPFPDSRWVAHQADASIANDPADETVEYEYCFCLRENFTNPEMAVRVLADDEVTDITLNGTALSFSGDGSVSVGNSPIEETYTDPGPFQAGENCLRITVVDTKDAVSGLNLDGRVRAENADCDCEPACDLSLEKSTTGEFHYGEQFQAGYVYEVCNEGEEACSGELEVTDPLPDGISGPVMPGSGLAGGVTNGTFEGTIVYSGLAPGECLTRQLVVTVEDADAFPGDPPNEVENCAELLEGGETVAEDCVTHPVTAGDDPCPPVAFDLNSGYDQDNGTTLGDGVDDDDWDIVADGTNSGTVPRAATVADSIESPGGSFADSRWISHLQNGDVSGGESFTYEYCFCLREGFSDPELVLEVQADDQVADIRLNGAALAFAGNGSFQGDPIQETYDDAELFQAGENCLSIVVEDTQDVFAGLNVSGTMTAQNADCECNPCAPTLSKETASEFHYGEQASYLFTVCNEGEAECTEPFDVVDDLPDGVSFVSAGGAWSGSVSGETVTVTNNSYGGLAPGDCIEFEMTVEVAGEDEFPGDPPGEVENCAVLSHDGEEVTEDCVTHPVTQAGECELSLQKSTAGEFHYGQEGVYVFEVCNEGEQVCDGSLAIVDDLPDGISEVSFDDGGSDGQIQPGECETWMLTVAVASQSSFPGDPPHEVENCAELTLDEETVDEDCVTHDITVNNDPCPPVAFDLNSGYDQDNGTTLGDGVDDDDWTIVADDNAPGSVPKQATVVNGSDIPGNWPAPFQDSRWVAHDASASSSPPGSAYEYEYCFCLREGFSDPELALQIRADNSITDIQLNGNSLDFDGDGGFLGDPIEETYTDPDRFQAGENCLTLVLENAGSEAGLNIAGTMAAENADCDCAPGGDPDCELSVEKSTTGEFHYGEQHQAGYVFEVCNEGETECSDELEIVDPLPDGISGPVMPGSGLAGGVSNGTFEGTIGYSGLAPGECFTRELLVTVEDADAFPGDPPSEVENCAELLAGGEAVAEGCVSHPVTPGEESDCEFTFQKDTTDEFQYGQQASYVFELCSDPDLNNGECTGPITIEDDLPDGISFVSVSGNWTATVSGGVVEATNDSYGGLAPGDCLAMEMTVEVADKYGFPGDPPHQVTNCADLLYSGDAAGSDCVEHTIQ